MSRAEIRASMEEGGCQHPRQRLTRKQFSNGIWHFVRQCENCWAQVGNYLKKEDAAKEIRYFDDVPIFDVEKSYQISEEQREFDRVEAEARRNEHREWYRETYLKSPEWRAKTALVRERCRGLCEGCRNAPCTQVHHLTYAHVGNELLWELVAVCDDCHARAHSDKHDAP